MAERNYQRDLIKKIYEKVPGCIVLKNDAGYKQGIPDLAVLYKQRYAILEVKKDDEATFRPNQEMYLESFGDYTFSARVEPENEEEVLNGLCEFFRI